MGLAWGIAVGRGLATGVAVLSGAISGIEPRAVGVKAVKMLSSVSSMRSRLFVEVRYLLSASKRKRIIWCRALGATRRAASS